MIGQWNLHIGEQLCAEWNTLTGQVHLTFLVHLDHVSRQMDRAGDAALHSQLAVQVVHQELEEQRLAFVRLWLVEFLLP